MANARVDKVNSELKRSIYEILSKKVKSPELTEMFSIVKVDTDKELTYAKVYVSVFSADKEKADKTFEAIKHSENFVRQCLFKEMRIKSVPQIVFLKDDSMEYSQKIEKMLSSLEGGKNEKE